MTIKNFLLFCGALTLTLFWSCGDTFTDPRDGKKYRTAVMPDGKTWMVKNLDHTPQNGNSWCYDNSTDSCAIYGRLYDWKTAAEICPDGWRLPSDGDWGGLMVAINPDCGQAAMFCDSAGVKLKSKKRWGDGGNGTDGHGFSALPGGLRFPDGDFINAGYYGVWWSATEDAGRGAYRREMGYDVGTVYRHTSLKSFGFSVRCIKK